MNVFFFLFSFLIIFSCLLMINSSNPVHSVFWLVFTFITSSWILIYLNLNFIPVIIILIYVGAIAILFLFVIMMLDILQLNLISNINNSMPLIILSLSMIIMILSSLNLNLIYSNLNELNLNLLNKSEILLIGGSIYTFFWEIFIIISILLLIAMIGAIILTLESKKTSKLQNLSNQHHRNNSWILI